MDHRLVFIEGWAPGFKVGQQIFQYTKEARVLEVPWKKTPTDLFDHIRNNHLQPSRLDWD